jgi:hypothetical protein
VLDCEQDNIKLATVVIAAAKLKELCLNTQPSSDDPTMPSMSVTFKVAEDQVPPHTSSKSRQGTGRASTRCHISCSFEPHLLAEVGSDAVMCPMALDLTSLLR